MLASAMEHWTKTRYRRLMRVRRETGPAESSSLAVVLAATRPMWLMTTREPVRPVTTVRSCRVSVTTADDVTHTVDVQAATVFEAAAAGLARFRDQGWVEPLAPTAVIRVEVQVAPVVHSVPLKALERWANGPSVSPKEEVLKLPLRRL